MNTPPALLLLLATALPPLAGAQDETERLWVQGEVNGHPVHFAFDTGAFTSVLTRQTVQKFGLQLMPPQTNLFFSTPGGGKQYLDCTKECTLKVGPIEGPMIFGVLDSPACTEPDFEAVLGWYTVINSVVSIDAMSGGVSFLYQIPPSVDEWAHIPAVATYSGLGLQIPRSNYARGVLLVDTGSDRGVSLPPQAWRKWRKAHPRAPITLGMEYSPSDGYWVYEEAWANSISFGPVTLENVPINESGPSGTEHLGKEYEGTVGLAALKRLELVVDASHAVAYWRPRKSTFSHYTYNRLGAAFGLSLKSTDKAVARVIKGSPAYSAGVRDGDVLLAVDGTRVTNCDENTGDWRNRFSLPAGTKLKLTLDRKGKVFQTTATLTDILQPNHNPAN